MSRRPHPGSAGEWEERYAGTEAVWSGDPNPSLVDVVTELDLSPGRSLDVGCGEGADVLWLAARGWQAVGIDVSATAIDRARAAAAAAGTSADFAVANLTDWAGATDDRRAAAFPRRGGFDLVTGCFLHTRIPDTREELLSRLGEFVAPGGHLILISHAGIPPWAAGHSGGGDGSHDHDAGRDAHAGHDAHDENDFRGPEEDFALLKASGTGDWELDLGEIRTRAVTAPDGSSVDLDDGILVARKV